MDNLTTPVLRKNTTSLVRIQKNLTRTRPACPGQQGNVSTLTGRLLSGNIPVVDQSNFPLNFNVCKYAHMSNTCSTNTEKYVSKRKPTGFRSADEEGFGWLSSSLALDLSTRILLCLSAATDYRCYCFCSTVTTASGHSFDSVLSGGSPHSEC